MRASAQVLLLFPTPVLVLQVEHAEALNARLAEAILNRMAADPGVVRSNRGGWHSKPDLFAWTGDAGQELLKHALDLANAHTVVPPSVGQISWKVDAWANVNSAGDANSAHVHGGAYWSAVYYVQAEDRATGKLVLHDPRMPALRMHAPMLRLKDAGPELAAELNPVAGQLIMFPSWLFHSVEPWSGESERISVALNMRAIPPGLQQ